MTHFPENLIPKADSSIEKEKYKHSLNVSLLGGSIEGQDTTNLNAYKELGKILSKEGVILSTGPITENTFINQVASQFVEEEKIQSKHRKGTSSPHLIEFIQTRRVGWVENAKKEARGAKHVKAIEGGVPLLTAALERPQTGLFIFCPPSLASSSTLAEALQVIAHIEVVIKNNQTAKEDETKAKAYPILPKTLFIDWPENDKRIMQKIISRSKILTPPDDPQKYSDLAVFLQSNDIPARLPNIITEQNKKFNNWFKTHRTTLSQDF